MKEPVRVGLFATCLVDLFRPNVGFAAVKLLEEAGCEVEVPPLQTCCGQPAYNSGDFPTSREVAKQVIAAFEGFDYVVAPSGSCAAVLKLHYPLLFPTDHHWRARAEALAPRCFELMQFLVDELCPSEPPPRFSGTVAYHDSCSGRRELGVYRQPRTLLDRVEGLERVEVEDGEVCCGFGGTFCVKYPKISERMVSDKAESVRRTGAGTLLGGDLGCLLNIAGRLSREGSPVKVYHAAEVLAEMADGPAIGRR